LRVVNPGFLQTRFLVLSEEMWVHICEQRDSETNEQIEALNRW
jgi:hypothetical protein